MTDTDTGIEGAESQVASIAIDRPEAGETLTLDVTSGLHVVLAFNPAAAKFKIEGDGFVLTLEDGGQIVFEGLISAAQGGNTPVIQIAGVDIAADLLIEQAMALAAAGPIETAAGEDGEGNQGESGGGSRYDDSFGDLIAGLIEQGVIGEVDLGFGRIGNGGTEFLVEAEFLSEGYLASSGGIASLGAGLPSGSGSAPLPGSGVPTSGPGSSGSSPDAAPPSGGDEAPAAYTIDADGMVIITNQATGNLQIPDELILFLSDADNGAGLSVSGLGYDGVTDNAFICAAGDPMPAGANTWAADGADHIIFHIGGGNPFYEGSLGYNVADGLGGTGGDAIGVQNAATANVGGYWTLDGAAGNVDEVLLGLDGRNNIDGGGGNDIIHGGHDSSGDILRGGDGNDVIFGGSGNDDLQGGNDDDTFIMRAGFGRDDVNGGDGYDVISLDSVLIGADVADTDAIDAWLTLNGDATYIHDAATDTITFEGGGVYSGTIDLGGGNEITFTDIEQIVYT